MIRVVRPTVGKLLAATLLVLCIGVQVLEASGRWDRALKDTNDEAIILVVVLCIGAAVAMAGALLTHVRPARIISHSVLAATSPSRPSATSPSRRAVPNHALGGATADDCRPTPSDTTNDSRSLPAATARRPTANYRCLGMRVRPRRSGSHASPAARSHPVCSCSRSARSADRTAAPVHG